MRMITMMSRRHLMASLKLNSSSSPRRGALVASSSSSLCVSTPLSLSSPLSSASSCYHHHRNQSTSSSSSSVHFPWRHSATPLPRIQNNDDYSGMPKNVRAKFVRKLIAIREMNLSFWDALPILPALLPGYRHEWERELSTNFEIAFRLALEELLCTLFSNLTLTLSDENHCVSIDTSKMMTRRKNDAAAASVELDANEKTTKTSESASNDYLNQMIDQTLLQKYQQLDLQHLQLKLTIKPIPDDDSNAPAVQLQNIFAVPMLTREIVNQKPHLKGAYQRMFIYELAKEVGLQQSVKCTV